jgi:hypothetical protein
MAEIAGLDTGESQSSTTTTRSSSVRSAPAASARPDAESVTGQSPSTPITINNGRNHTHE